jgi:hypothetical protein
MGRYNGIFAIFDSMHDKNLTSFLAFLESTHKKFEEAFSRPQGFSLVLPQKRHLRNFPRFTKNGKKGKKRKL